MCVGVCSCVLEVSLCSLALSLFILRNSLFRVAAINLSQRLRHDPKFKAFTDKKMRHPGKFDVIEELYATCVEATPIFEDLLRDVLAKANVDPDSYALVDGETIAIESGAPWKHLTLPPLKEMVRSREEERSDELRWRV